MAKVVTDALSASVVDRGGDDLTITMKGATRMACHTAPPPTGSS